MEYISNQKSKRTFRDIVLDQLHKILELSCEEFRGGYTQKQLRGNSVEEVYIPDARKRICQAIEFFSFLIQPKYDTAMKEKSEKIKKEIQENLQEYNDKKITAERFTLNKLNLMKTLFEELNFLLSSKDYLKGDSYEDTSDEEEGTEIQ